ncbi:MAG: hypothetical protein K1X88_11660 [Nannocystaceae bacterium]|nr:hypothetical protein [Nannocystaceae bacterium]
MASWSELGLAVALALAAGGCRSGLPSEPPADDAARVQPDERAWQARPNPLTRSAFEGEALPAGGHEHHGHHGHGATAPASSPEESTR